MVTESYDMPPLQLTVRRLLARLRGRSAPLPVMLEFADGERGVTFDKLFGPYLSGAARIVVIDPYIREFYQFKNLMELLDTIIRHQPADQSVDIHLITTASEEPYTERQLDFLEKVQAAAETVGLSFSWEFVEPPQIHDRAIVTDTGWKILLGRGLGIFHWFDVNNAFDFSNRLQIFRKVRGFHVTYARI
jgi:ATP-dependent Lon protease